MILFLIGLIASIPISVVANIWTPTIRTWLAQRSSSRKQKRVKQLKKEAREVCDYHDGPSNHMIAYSARNIVGVLANYIGATMFVVAFLVGFITNGNVALTSTCAILGTIGLFYATYSITRFQRSLRKVERFEEYKARMIREITSLGGPVDDIWPNVDSTDKTQTTF